MAPTSLRVKNEVLSWPMWLELPLCSCLLAFLLVSLLHSLWRLHWLLLLLKITLQISTELMSPPLSLFLKHHFLNEKLNLTTTRPLSLSCQASVLFPQQFSISNRLYGLLTGSVYSVSVIVLLKQKLPMGSNICNFHSLAHPQQLELYLEQGRCSKDIQSMNRKQE